MNTPKPARRVIRAYRISDGTHVIRAGCCDPARCTVDDVNPTTRCCDSDYCVCPFPAGTRPRIVRPTPKPRVTVGRVVSSGLAVGVTVGLGWMTVQTVAWVIANSAVVLGGGILACLILLAVIRGATRDRRRSCTVTVTHRH